MNREGEGTKFTIDRKIFSSDIWFASPWKLKIWIYLIGHANHEDNHFMGVDLKRGQLIRSLRKIQKDCGYKVGYRMKYPTLDTVRRICEDLTKESRIVRRSVHQGYLITICNYDDLQTFSKPRNVRRSDKSSYSSRTVVVQDNNTKNIKNEITILLPNLFYEIPLIKRDGNHIVTLLDIKEFEEIYPGIDVKRELIKCRKWNIDNPKKRKTRSGIKKHLSVWMDNAQNRVRGQVVKSEERITSGDCVRCGKTFDRLEDGFCPDCKWKYAK